MILIVEASIHLDSKVIYTGGQLGGSVGGDWSPALWLPGNKDWEDRGGRMGSCAVDAR